MLIGGLKSGWLSVVLVCLPGLSEWNRPGSQLILFPRRTAQCRMNRPIEIPAAASSSVMVITEHGGIAVCVCLSAYFPFWWVINYITLSLIDLCTLCLDRVTFIAVGPSNIIMAIHHVQGQQRCPF